MGHFWYQIIKQTRAQRSQGRSQFFFRIAILSLLTVFSAGCSIEATLTELSPKVPDFLKTEIISNGPGTADGISELIVVVQLKNSDLSVVSGYKPTYEITAGGGVITSECTESLTNGLSYCVLRATQSGVKRLRLTNARIGLEKDVIFDPKQGGLDVQGIIAGSLQKGTTASGYQIESSTGGLVNEIQTSTSDGYIMYSTVQGALISGN